MNLPAGILGAGLGSRMASKAKAKPLALLAGEPILARLVKQLYRTGCGPLFCALRDELMDDADRKGLPAHPTLHFSFVNTPSSLHTLLALCDAMATEVSGSALFLMADSVLLDKDLRRFLELCQGLAPHEGALLVTPHVDDEKPLWVSASANFYAQSIGAKQGQFVTSGLYWLTPEMRTMAAEYAQKGGDRMRGFLQYLEANGFPFKLFVAAKTLDIDHPSDLEEAAQFLGERME